ncbi:MAG TPA: hypothetical protein VGB99_18450, partial [Acidobacteriota bacterium]
MRNLTWPLVLCVVVGALGGALADRLVSMSLLPGAVLGALYGLVFALLATRRANSPGAGLLWALGYVFVLWLAIPAALVPYCRGECAMGDLDMVRTQYPQLVAYVLCFGLPLGIALGTLGLLRTRKEAGNPFSLPRALLVGGIAGLISGWIFGVWMMAEGFLPLVAGLIHAGGGILGFGLHLIFSTLIGIGFGLLFQRDV